MTNDYSALTTRQLELLRQLLTAILPRNRFYAHKLAGVASDSLHTLEELQRLPFTSKAELLNDQIQNPPYGTALTFPLEDYRRYSQTSGTTARPLRWLDTADSWQWMLNCWRKLYQLAGVTPADRLFFAFSFGPFLGFWTGFEAGQQLGCLCLPGGGMSSAARLRFLLDNEVTVVLCTPTYALHLTEVAREHNLDLAQSAVRLLIVAGEPGGSISATRQRLEMAWGARLLDHSGLTEVGPMTIECADEPGGLIVLEEDYLVEVLDPETGVPVGRGEVGELVVTNFGRWGSPVIRYRTGDLVKAEFSSRRGSLRLEGGILGRTDGLLHVRGNNVYPSALEAVIRSFSDVVEYRVEVDRSESLAELRIAIEPTAEAVGPDLTERIRQAIREQLLFRAEVNLVAPGSLPRFEHKAQRIVIR